MTKFKGVESIAKVHDKDYMIMINHIYKLTTGGFAPMQILTFVTETNKLLYMFLGIELFKGFDLDSGEMTPERDEDFQKRCQVLDRPEARELLRELEVGNIYAAAAEEMFMGRVENIGSDDLTFKEIANAWESLTLEEVKVAVNKAREKIRKTRTEANITDEDNTTKLVTLN